MSSVLPYVLAFAGFSALIILHEFGHFAAAKATGMRVERFFLFFPPKLVSKRRGETEYGIGAIPAGGFVKITGMNPDEELPPDVAPRAYYHQPVWKRIVVIGAGPTVNILLAFIILFILAFSAQKATTIEVSKTEEGTPAARTLQEGDRLISVDGVRADPEDLEASATRFSDTINSHRCAGEATPKCRAATPVRLVIVRNGERRVLEARPFYDPNVERNRLGFGFQGGGLVADHTGPVGAAKRSLDLMWLVTHKTAEVFANIFDAEQRKQVSGIVGSYEVTRQAIGFSAREALTLLAVISLSLGLINLLPFLPLDGGHIFWSLVEKVRGHPVPFRLMERASAIGILLILMLFFIGLQNDIGRLTGEGFNVR